MPKPTRNQIYDSVIRRMVRQALEAQEDDFAKAHGADSDEALLQVLTNGAARLGHSPWPEEFAGGVTILNRFASWADALSRAGLELPAHPNRPEAFSRYRQEMQCQKILYRQRKAEKKQKARERLQAQEINRQKK